MATRDSTQTGAPLAQAEVHDHGRQGPRRLTTETKSAFKTTEFVAYLVTFVLILIAGNAIEIEEGGTDYFAADKVWLYITILTVGYMISRGIAKAGSRDPYWEEPGDRNARH